MISKTQKQDINTWEQLGSLMKKVQEKSLKAFKLENESNTALDMYVLDLYRLHTTNGKIFDYLTNSYRDSYIKFSNNGRNYLEKILDACYHYILVSLKYYFKESNLVSLGLKSGKKLKTNSFDIFKDHVYSKFSTFEEFFEDFCMTITILEVEKITVSAESTLLPTKISYRVGQAFQKLLLEICFE